MTSYKKTLLNKLFPVLISSVFLPSPCSHRNELTFGEGLDPPLDGKGYPKSSPTLVNGKICPMDLVGGAHAGSEAGVKIDKGRDELEADLPQCPSVNTWSLEGETYLNVTSYSKIAYPIKEENMLEGSSPSV